MQASADGDESIFGITAALGASKAGMAGAISISINTISPTNEAYFGGEKSTGIAAEGDVKLSATDDSTIQTIAGGIGITGGVVGFGISFAYDDITGTTETELLNSVPVITLGTLRTGHDFHADHPAHRDRRCGGFR